MSKRAFVFLFILSLISCDELQQVVNQIPEGNGGLSEFEIAAGLREALDQGIDKQVVKLASENGFYGNDLVKILLPEQLRKVDKTLRDIGLRQLADEGLKLMNRAAEDAVKEASPIFVDAVKEIRFADARAILLGEDNAATQFLIGKTESPLYQKFKPVIENSFTKVGADRIWENLIQRYNQIPLVEPVNPELSDYVTQEALKGVYTMIAIEEKQIRTDISARTTTLLKRVFSIQD